MFQTKSCSIFALVIGLVLLQISEGSAESKLLGKFKFNGDPNCPHLDKFLTELGLSSAGRALAKEVAPKMAGEISKEGEVYRVTVTIPMFKTIENKFQSGKEYEEEHFVGPKTTTTATVDGDKITWVRELKPGRKLTEVFQCREEGCTSNYTLGEANATVEWKREK